MEPKIAGWRLLAGGALPLEAATLLIYGVWGLTQGCPSSGCEGANIFPAFGAALGGLLILLALAFWRGSNVARLVAAIAGVLQLAVAAWLAFGLANFACLWSASGCPGYNPLLFVLVGGLALAGVVIALGSILSTPNPTVELNHAEGANAGRALGAVVIVVFGLVATYVIAVVLLQLVSPTRGGPIP